MEDSAEDSSPVLVHRRRHLRFPHRRLDQPEDSKGSGQDDRSVLDHPWFRSFDHLCLQLRQVCLIFLTAVLPLSLSVISMIWYNGGGGGGAAGSDQYKLSKAVAPDVDQVEDELYATETYVALRQEAGVVSQQNLDFLLVVDRRHNLSYEEFIAVYDGKRPVILTDVVPDWAASRWSRDFFLENYANDSAVVKTVDGNGSSISSASTRLADFAAESSRGQPERWMYLEDELFIPTRPELRADLGEVEVLGEDFFQLFPKAVRPWDALLLWGSPSSRSPLHMDPYNWTGINAVISGRKKWKLFPPGQDHLFYITPGQRCGFPLDCIKYNSPVDTFSPNNTRYPDVQQAEFAEVDQVAGELLVIPTGWFHQAYNMEETIAVSRQVMNTNSYREVMEEIIKAGNVQRAELPPNFAQLSPRLQVQTLVDLLPGEILEKGRLLTEAVLGQINSLL
ncbi:uncharacterized protein [Branchiostoma lanceolatum]|uniref:uncharacterized protein n=1 Tax=Branchiostoma lanceolatum TaxID=7740 RepID=UPI00345169CF